MKRLLRVCVSVLALAAGAAGAPMLAHADWLEDAAKAAEGYGDQRHIPGSPRLSCDHQAPSGVRKETGIKVNYEIVPFENTPREGSAKLHLARRSHDGPGRSRLDRRICRKRLDRPDRQFHQGQVDHRSELKLDGFFPLLLDAFGSWGGKTYGLPFDNYSGLMFYNSCKLKDAGFRQATGNLGRIDERYTRQADRRIEEPICIRPAIAARRRTQSADSFMRMLWPFGGSLLDKQFKST